jgi:hypothetical protein
MHANRIKGRSRRLAAVALAASAAVTGLAASGPAAAASTRAPLHLTGLSLVVTWQNVKNLTSAGRPQVGTDTDYDISIYAADGTVVGHQKGNTLIVYIDPVNGDIYVYQHDVVKIAGGTLVDDGVVNVLAGFRGVPQTLYARGVGGRLTGEFGVFHETPVHAVLPPKIWQAEADIELN